MMKRFGNSAIYGRAWQFVYLRKQTIDRKFLEALCPDAEMAKHQLKNFAEELCGFEPLRDSVAACHKIVPGHIPESVENLFSDSWVFLLYCLVRLNKPRIVIETGCATGTTTSAILCAMEKNGDGHLYSIDQRYASDWLIQNNLRAGSWSRYPQDTFDLLMEDCKTALPSLLARLGGVDFFLHDSDHSYIHQMWEYLTAWPYLSGGGILATDDLSDNTALFDLARQVTSPMSITDRGHTFGAIRKVTSEGHGRPSEKALRGMELAKHMGIPAPRIIEYNKNGVAIKADGADVPIPLIGKRT